MIDLLNRLALVLILRGARLSPRWQARVAAVVGTLAWLVVARRRRIAARNLAACFPALPPARRRALVRRLFQRGVRAALDYGTLWTGSADEVRRLVRIEGLEHLQEHGAAPLILLVPHFVGLDAGATRLALEISAVSIYARQSNRFWDHWLHHGRTRFKEQTLIPRRGFDLRKVVRTLRSGLPFFYLPDMDHGDRNSIFVPFFGVPAATLPMVSRLARTLEARVLMVVAEQTATGYVLHIEPPWQDFPGASVEADTLRMNREIERWVLKLPDQYLWTHRRFKTRPAGDAPFYGR